MGFIRPAFAGGHFLKIPPDSSILKRAANVNFWQAWGSECGQKWKQHRAEAEIENGLADDKR